MPASRPLLQPAIDIISQQTSKYRDWLLSSKKSRLTSRDGNLNQPGNDYELSYSGNQGKGKKIFGSAPSTERVAPAADNFSYQKRWPSEEQNLPERGQELVQRGRG